MLRMSISALLRCAALAAAVAACTPDNSRLADRSVPIENFAEVAEGVYRGAQPDSAGFRALADMGVKTVINLRANHDDRQEASRYDIEVVPIPMSAGLSLDPPTDEDVRKFFDVVLDPKRRPVFFHCAEGKDRTGTMCALYRMEVDGWTPERAHEEMEAFGWHDDIYRALGKFVLEYRPRGFAQAPR
jgi:protein tyrosine/serine phosphatase